MINLNDAAENRFVILLADNDENELLLIRRAVYRLNPGAHLLTVSAGEHVFAYLEGSKPYADRQRHPAPSVILLDQSMPRWSGLDVLLWIRSSRKFAHLPVVLLSLGLSPADAQAARLLKAAACAKTPQLELLPAAIDQAFGFVAAEGMTSPAHSPSSMLWRNRTFAQPNTLGEM
jgi:CheY-like chemotaxis protein